MSEVRTCVYSLEPSCIFLDYFSVASSHRFQSWSLNIFTRDLRGLRSLCTWTCDQWESGFMNAAADVALCLHGNLAVTLVIPLMGGRGVVKCKVSFLECRRCCWAENALRTNKPTAFFSKNSQLCLNLSGTGPSRSAPTGLCFRFYLWVIFVLPGFIAFPPERSALV